MAKNKRTTSRRGNTQKVVPNRNPRREEQAQKQYNERANVSMRPPGKQSTSGSGKGGSKNQSSGGNKPEASSGESQGGESTKK